MLSECQKSLTPGSLERRPAQLQPLHQASVRGLQRNVRRLLAFGRNELESSQVRQRWNRRWGSIFRLALPRCSALPLRLGACESAVVSAYPAGSPQSMQSMVIRHSNARSSRFLCCRTDAPGVGSHRPDDHGFWIRCRTVWAVSTSACRPTAGSDQLH